MKFTHIDQIDGRLCKIDKVIDGSGFADWGRVTKFYSLYNTIEREIINMAFLEKLKKPISKEIDFNYSSYC